MKILHVTSVRELSQGQRKQLDYECGASSHLEGADWTCVALHSGKPLLSFERQIPVAFRKLFLKNLFTWLFLIRESRKYDYILCRHMAFDPFVFVFGWFVPNRVTIHHAKETQELKLVRKDWRGKAASLLERVCGWGSSRQVCGILGVTSEIARYEYDLYKARCPIGVYPNGIEIDGVDILSDQRVEDVNIAFLCGVFSPWQGLDRLVTAFRASRGGDGGRSVTVHLIGAIDRPMTRLVDAWNREHQCFFMYGSMNQAEYRSILAKCDFGLDSLAIDRKQLSEGASLKVREYLAFGLPVFSVHGDAGIPRGHLYYRQGRLDIEEMIDFALSMKTVSRQEVRRASAKYISKKRVMEGVCVWLREIRGKLKKRSG